MPSTPIHSNATVALRRRVRHTAVVVAAVAALCTPVPPAAAHAHTDPAPPAVVATALAAARSVEGVYRAELPVLVAEAEVLARQERTTTVDGWIAARRAGRGAQAWAAQQAAAAATRAAHVALVEDLTALAASRRVALVGLATAAAGAAAADPLAAAWADAPLPALDVVFDALGWLGVPYRFGAAGPSAFDCSGFTRTVFAAQRSLPHKAAFQLEVLDLAPTAAPAVADLVFFGGGPTAAGPHAVGHVAIALGAGWVVHASSAADGVVVDPLTELRPPVGHATAIPARV